MGRRKMTEEQKLAQKMDEQCQAALQFLADGLAVYKNRNKKTNLEIANDWHIGVNTVSLLLGAKEAQTSLTTKEFLRLMIVCGLTIGKKQEVINEMS